MARARQGWRIEIAARTTPRDWTETAKRLLGVDGADRIELLAYHDSASGQYRFAAFDEHRLVGAVFYSRQPVAVPRAWAAGLLGATWTDPRQRLGILAARPPADRPDTGAIVCACFEVGVNQIAAQVATGKCCTVAEIGAALAAGTNCGSCRPEIARIIEVSRPVAAQSLG